MNKLLLRTFNKQFFEILIPNFMIFEYIIFSWFLQDQWLVLSFLTSFCSDNNLSYDFYTFYEFLLNF